MMEDFTNYPYTTPIRLSTIHSRREDGRCIDDCMACANSTKQVTKQDFWTETDEIWEATPFDQAPVDQDPTPIKYHYCLRCKTPSVTDPDMRICDRCKSEL